MSGTSSPFSNRSAITRKASASTLTTARTVCSIGQNAGQFRHFGNPTPIFFNCGFESANCGTLLRIVTRSLRRAPSRGRNHGLRDDPPDSSTEFNAVHRDDVGIIAVGDVLIPDLVVQLVERLERWSLRRLEARLKLWRGSCRQSVSPGFDGLSTLLRPCRIFTDPSFG